VNGEFRSRAKYPARILRHDLAISPLHAGASWHLDCVMAGMTQNATPHVQTQRLRPRQRRPMLRWILGHETGAITCQLNVRGTHSYEVCVVPHWDPALAVIEHYDAPTRALLRHADLVRDLREGGWTVIDHVAADGMHAAA
jgi:hypothetical protein